MAIDVSFESPLGTIVTTRKFAPFQSIRINAVPRGPLGWPEPFLTVRFELIGPGFTPYYTDANSGWDAVATVDWVLPDINTTATVKLTAIYDIGFDEVVQIPIGIGLEPPLVPGEGVVLPELIWLGVAGVGLLLLLAPRTVVTTYETYSEALKKKGVKRAAK